MHATLIHTGAFATGGTCSGICVKASKTRRVFMLGHRLV
jgi:hypothetical protein